MAWGLTCAWGMGFQIHRAKDIAAYFNALLIFEGDEGKRARKKKVSVLEEFRCLLSDTKNGETGRFVLFMGFLTHLSTPLLMLLYILARPCDMVYYIRSTLPDCPLRGGMPAYLQLPQYLAPLVIGMDVYMVWYEYSQGIHQFIFTYNCGVTCIVDMLKRYVKVEEV